MTKKSVVIVEDDKDLLDTLGYFFKEEGFLVRKFNKGKKVIDSVYKVVPDVIVIDLILPDAEGDCIASIIKLDKKFESTKVVLISASDNLARKAEAAGVNTYLLKPFAFDTLIKLV